jgi:plasmid replication initiation protein
MSHALTTAAQGLSLAEKRVMMFAVAKLDGFKPDGGTPNGTVKIVAHDYAEQFGVDPTTAYEQLKSAGDGIFNRYIRFFEETGKGPKEVKVRWVSRAEYHPGEGWVSLRFTSDVAPHLLDLKRQFTTYKLAQASALRSIYSWRLLELLSQTISTGWRQIDLKDFHYAMETPEGYKANFKDCRQRVVEPAVKELREKDGWLIEWTPIKSGRKVTALRFEFKRNPQGQLHL